MRRFNTLSYVANCFPRLRRCVSNMLSERESSQRCYLRALKTHAHARIRTLTYRPRAWPWGWCPPPPPPPSARAHTHSHSRTHTHTYTHTHTRTHTHGTLLHLTRPPYHPLYRTLPAYLPIRLPALPSRLARTLHAVVAWLPRSRQVARGARSRRRRCVPFHALQWAMI